MLFNTRLGMGATPPEQVYLDGHSSHPSVVDVPNMDEIFGRIYSILSPFAKK